MMDVWTDIGLFSATLLWIAVLVKLTRRWLPRNALMILVVLAVAVAMVPIKGLVVGSYIFSLTSYLSISTLLLLLVHVVFSCVESRVGQLQTGWQSSRQWLPITVFFVVSALLLYPLAGGLTMIDSYRLGFSGSPQSVVLPLYLMSWAVICVLRGWYLLLLLIVCAVLGFYLKMLPSLNLWDYVMDPLVVIYSLFMLLKPLCRRVFQLQQLNKQVY